MPLYLFCFYFRIVEFKDNETAIKAVELMHKYEVRGRALNVKIVCNV